MRRHAGLCANCGITEGPFINGPLPRQRLCDPRLNLYHEQPGNDKSPAHMICNMRRDLALSIDPTNKVAVAKMEQTLLMASVAAFADREARKPQVANA